MCRVQPTVYMYMYMYIYGYTYRDNDNTIGLPLSNIYLYIYTVCNRKKLGKRTIRFDPSTFVCSLCYNQCVMILLQMQFWVLFVHT